MADKTKLKSDIRKLKSAIASKSTPKTIIPKLKSQLEKAENELANLSKGKKTKSTHASTNATLSKLQTLVKKNKKYSIYKGSSTSNLQKDAERPALPMGKRTSQGLRANKSGSKKANKGHTYYEYRRNRIDVKQPRSKQKYPILEDGGMMARGGKIKKYELGDMWSEDFNYDGMLKMGMNARITWGLEKLQALSDSFEDVNYHTENIKLREAIDFLKKGDELKSKQALGTFNLICRSELGNQGFAKDKMADGGMANGGKYYVMDAKDGKIVSKGFDTEEEAKVEKFRIFEMTSNPFLTQKKMAEGGMMEKGAKLVGNQYKLDVNKNGRLDKEDFKMLRGEKMEKGGETNIKIYFAPDTNLGGKPMQGGELRNFVKSLYNILERKVDGYERGQFYFDDNYGTIIVNDKKSKDYVLQLLPLWDFKDVTSSYKTK